MSKNTRHIVIKDYSKLEKYGFVKQGSAYYFYTGNQSKFGDVWTIHISKGSRHQRKKGYTFYCTSHTSTTLEVICKLYKDGIISFEEYRDNERIIEKKRQKIAQLQKEIEELENDTR